jgi:predicted DNA-binding transcriptional regulator YafY
VNSASEQLARLLSLVPWLQAHPGITKTAAAAAFGISTGQLEKDLRLAFTCELPGQPDVFIDIDYLDSDRVSVLDAGTIDRPLRLRPEEAVALLVGLRALAAVPGLADRGALDSALAKLEDAAGLAVDPSGPAPGRDEAPTSRREDTGAALRDALSRHRRLRLKYWVPSRDEVTDRDVDPIRVVTVEDVAYLEGYCYASEAVRTFRFDRIVDATVLEVRAEAPVDSRGDPPNIFHPSPEDTLVCLELGSNARWVPDYYACESVTERPGGGLLATMRTADPRLVLRLVLRLGGAARILEPVELAVETSQAASAALARYEPGS